MRKYVIKSVVSTVDLLLDGVIRNQEGRVWLIALRNDEARKLGGRHCRSSVASGGDWQPGICEEIRRTVMFVVG